MVVKTKEKEVEVKLNDGVLAREDSGVYKAKNDGMTIGSLKIAKEGIKLVRMHRGTETEARGAKIPA